MSRFNYQIENLLDLKEEIYPLFEEHYKEISLVQDVMDLEPNWGMYQSLQDNGYLRTYTVRENGELKGYFVVINMPSLHYASNNLCMCDLIFVTKSIRGTMAGPRLIKMAEKDLESLGADALAINTKAHADFGPLLEKFGYSVQETVYSKCFKRKGTE